MFKENKRKGVSPIIAAVMLITIAVGLGAFVTVWYKQSATSQATDVLATLGTSPECESVKFEVSYDYAGCKLYVFNNGQFKIDNVSIGYFATDKSSKVSITDSALPKVKPGRCVDAIPASWLSPPQDTQKTIDKFKITPLIIRDGKAYACPNEMEFKPTGTFTNCATSNC